MSISNEEREKQITIPSHHLLLFTLTKHSTWPINFWEARSVVVKWCFLGRNTLFAATADGKQPPCEFHWKAILSFSTPFFILSYEVERKKILGLQKHAYWQTITCVPHCILYLQKPLREHYLHLNPKDTWLQRVQGVASIHYSAFNPVTS